MGINRTAYRVLGKSRWRGIIGAVALVAHLSIGLAVAADTAGANKAPPPSSEWHFSIAPYAWAFAMTGKIGVGKQSANVNVTFLDVLQDSDSLMAFAGHIEAQYDRFGLFFDGTYADIGAKYKGRFLSAKMNQKISFIETGVFLRVIEDQPLWHPSPEIGGGSISVDALAGARYTYIGLDTSASLTVFDQTVKRNFDPSQDWVDPFIGARLMLRLTEGFDFSLRGDIGGFGVGSDLTWNTQALFGYHFALGNTVGEAWAGYRALSQDYDSGSGRRAFKWDVIFHGPVIGMSVSW